jgi:hypothetical protein
LSTNLEGGCFILILLERARKKTKFLLGLFGYYTQQTINVKTGFEP